MIKTSRPFRERFLNGYDRSQLREEVQKVKPRGFASLRKKYATWALGASLAVTGMGIPLKFGHSTDHASPKTTPQTAAAPLDAPPPTDAINNDLSTAQKIANQVKGGVTTAMSDVAQTVKEAPAAVAEAPAAVAQAATTAATDIAESAKEHFFKTQVPFGQLIYNEAKKNDLKPELVAAVVQQESKFLPTARSHAGAVGLMQLVPRTGRWMGARNLTDPTQNVTAGAKYLRYLTDRFNGNTEKAVAAYNAGEGAVRRFGGVPPFRETRNYVQRVLGFQSDIADRASTHQMPQQNAELR